MTYKTWNEMTPAEQAEINRQEDAREARKEAMSASDDLSEPSDEDMAEYFARMEERMDGIHRDSLYW